MESELGRLMRVHITFCELPERGNRIDTLSEELIRNFHKQCKPELLDAESTLNPKQKKIRFIPRDTVSARLENKTNAA